MNIIPTFKIYKKFIMKYNQHKLMKLHYSTKKGHLPFSASTLSITFEVLYFVALDEKKIVLLWARYDCLLEIKRNTLVENF